MNFDQKSRDTESSSNKKKDPSKKAILNSVLLEELIAIRTDTLYRFI
jgi:hypothetical protein